jgi:coniferyl-aldehyde dehydrogenase
MSMTARILPLQPPTPTARTIFLRQKAACRRHPFPTLEERRTSLAKLEALLTDQREAIADAVCRDFGHRSRHETQILEIFPALDGLRHARRHLKRWMRPARRPVSLLFAGARNRVIPQPKGVVGIIAPWNYPLFLVISPLTSALAAGNRCMIKMAANSQNLCRLLHDLIGRVFDEDLLAVLPGVAAADFTPLPFDHLIYTGSPASGRTVMKTAAGNLTPVTLELGGKSPAIVAPDFATAAAAERILYAKFMNAGQTCVAPDYLLLPEDRLADFVAAARRIVPTRYPNLETPDYTSIINEDRYRRLMELLDDARARGASLINLVPGSAADPSRRKIPPTLVTNVNSQMALMAQEIFGPVLPIITYRRLAEAIDYVNQGERPLALYLFTRDRANRQQVLEHTMSGGVSINDCALHVAQHDLPFGGIGESGMGQYHGREGFREFSKLRPVFHQARRPLSAVFLYPPYGRRFALIFRLLLRWRWF